MTFSPTVSSFWPLPVRAFASIPFASVPSTCQEVRLGHRLQKRLSFRIKSQVRQVQAPQGPPSCAEAGAAAPDSLQALCARVRPSLSVTVPRGVWFPGSRAWCEGRPSSPARGSLTPSIRVKCQRGWQMPPPSRISPSRSLPPASASQCARTPDSPPGKLVPLLPGQRDGPPAATSKRHPTHVLISHI